MPVKVKRKPSKQEDGKSPKPGTVLSFARVGDPPTGAPKKKKAQEVRIGARMRHARLSKDLSLRELADAVGCSESFVSKIENNKVRPSIAMLHRLSTELDINIGTLFDDSDDASDVQVLRQGKRRVITVDPEWQGRGVTLEQVIPQRAAALLQSNILEVAPGGYSDGLIEHSGEEFGYVLSGEINFIVGKEIYSLSAGDCIFFRSPLAHGYRNVSSVNARVLWVNTPPSF